ncbi:hypothetical protein IWW46_002565, partial [Coemansia sp. RSA 2440]
MKKSKRRPGSKGGRRQRHTEPSMQSATQHETNSSGPVDHISSSRTSRHRSSSQVPSLTSAILQYMPSMDDDQTDVLASRYYANMAALPSDADRLPRPMNSTLPMFSRSVISGRTRLPSRASDGSLQGQRQTEAGAREDVLRIGRSMSAVTQEVDRARGTSCPREDVEGGGVEVCGDKARRVEGIEPGADTEPVPSDHREELAAAEPAQPDHHEELTATELAQPDHEELTATELAQPDHEQPLDRRASTGSYIGTTVDEKGGLGLHIASRPPSHITRRTQPIAPTQYKPAAKKTAIARAAPGLSYMFSPTLGSSTSSRPSSIIGTTTPTAQHVQSRVQSVLPTRMAQTEHVHILHGAGEPEQSLDEAEHGVTEDATDDATRRAERKLYGSINVGALEQFLEEGRVPDTSSDEFSDSEWDGDYYSGSEA